MWQEEPFKAVCKLKSQGHFRDLVRVSCEHVAEYLRFP